MTNESSERIDQLVDNLKAASRTDRVKDLEKQGLSSAEAFDRTKDELQKKSFSGWKFREIIDKIRPRINNN